MRLNIDEIVPKGSPLFQQEHPLWLLSLRSACAAANKVSKLLSDNISGLLHVCPKKSDMSAHFSANAHFCAQEEAKSAICTAGSTACHCFHTILLAALRLKIQSSSESHLGLWVCTPLAAAQAYSPTFDPKSWKVSDLV